jgi:3-oxoacyl-[acyl-carrier protein] reductase
MAERKLAGKVALVTGGSRGIGAAICRRLAGEGAKVVVNYSKSPDNAHEVVAAIQADGGEAVAVQADTSDPAAIQALFAACQSAFGPPHIVVNNAAIMKRGMLPDVTVEDIDRHLNINVRGYLLVAQQAAAVMGRGGVILNVSSAISRMAYPGAVVYTATKGAIDVMTRVLAAELGPRGIRVNAVAPGSTVTDMNSKASGKTDEEARQEIEMTALRRQGHVTDIADAVALLCTEDARWVTGAWLDVSGGIRL